MHKTYILAFVLLFSSIAGAENWPGYDLLSKNHLQFSAATQISIKKDAVYQAEKHYQAFPLSTIIKKLAKNYKASVSNSLIVFTAKDGYKVTMFYSDALTEHGYIAFKDLAAEQASWLKFKFGGKYTSPDPYYLVWPNSELDKWRYPSPFQLTHISLQSIESYYANAAPESNNSQIKKGFTLFSRYCMRCHSVNHAGGKLGPELNDPRNVTDYFAPEQLTDFILDASAFNTTTKMPVFQKILSKKQVLMIQLYLKSMKSIGSDQKE